MKMKLKLLLGAALLGLAVVTFWPASAQQVLYHQILGMPGNPIEAGYFGALATTRSNLAAPTSLYFTNTPDSWTNTTGVNVFVLLGNQVGITTNSINGSVVETNSSYGTLIPLQPNEYVTVVHSNTVSARWKPY